MASSNFFDSSLFYQVYKLHFVVKSRQEDALFYSHVTRKLAWLGAGNKAPSQVLRLCLCDLQESLTPTNPSLFRAHASKIFIFAVGSVLRWYHQGLPSPLIGARPLLIEHSVFQSDTDRPSSPSLSHRRFHRYTIFTMAEEDAEIALLHQLQAGQESVAWEDGGENGVAEGELPSKITEHNNQEVQKEVATDDQVLRALSPSGADNVSDGGEYDPSSVITTQPAVTAIAGEAASRSSSRTSTRKRKTVGGFLADDSDEETDTTTPTQPSASLQPPASNTPKRFPSPLQTSVTQQDVAGAPENPSDSKAAPNPSHVPSVNSGPSSTVQAPAAQILTSAGPSQGVSVPKARLPNDKTGILEDKIKEDPRGDLDAWLSLISEHRSRHKFDEAIEVYERFLKVFPQAVST